MSKCNTTSIIFSTILINPPKLTWYKQSRIEEHLVDAAFIYQIQKENLDEGYLNKWVRKLKITKLFSELPKIDLDEYM